MIVHHDLRRAPCVRPVIVWAEALFAEHRDIIAGVLLGPQRGQLGPLPSLAPDVAFAPIPAIGLAAIKPSCSTQSRRSLAGGDDTCLKYEVGQLCFGCPRRRLDVLGFGQPRSSSTNATAHLHCPGWGSCGLGVRHPRPSRGFRGKVLLRRSHRLMQNFQNIRMMGHSSNLLRRLLTRVSRREIGSLSNQ